MGSDLHMNPPKRVYETHRGLTEDEAVAWVIGAMANNYEITVLPGEGDAWTVRVFKGEWN